MNCALAVISAALAGGLGTGATGIGGVVGMVELGWIAAGDRFVQVPMVLFAVLAGLVAGGYAGYALVCREG